MKGTPKSSHLRLLHGKAGHRPIRDEARAKGDLLEPPAELPVGARPFWWRAINSAPPHLLKRVDSQLLTVWAVAAWLHARASADLAVESIMEPDKNGILRRSPLFTILNQQAGIMLKASAEMGFSPAARIRVAVPPECEGSEFDEFA